MLESAMAILDGLILSGPILWLSFKVVVLSKLNTEIIRAFVRSQTTISAQKQNSTSKQYIWWKNDKGCSKPNYFLLWLYQQQPVLLVTVCLRPHIREGKKLYELSWDLTHCRNMLISRLVCSVMIWQFSVRLWGLAFDSIYLAEPSVFHGIGCQTRTAHFPKGSFLVSLLCGREA